MLLYDTSIDLLNLARQLADALYNTLDLQLCQLRSVASEGCTNLEESLDPPNLKNALGDQDHDLEKAPPLDSSISALGGISVCPFSDDDVALLVLDLCDQFRKNSNWEFINC
jgi:hypothetical protein